MPIYGIVAQELFVAPPPPAGNPARFIAVGNTPTFDAPILFTTENDDASTWVDRSAAAAAAEPFALLQAVAYSASLARWVAVGDDSVDPKVVYSDDGGNTWTAATADPSTGFFIRAICWTGTAFIAVGMNSAQTNPIVMTSANGIAWTQRTSAPTTGHQWGCVTGISGLAVAGGPPVGVGGSLKTMTSTNDGVAWTEHSTGFGSMTAVTGIALHSGGTHAAVGFSSSGNLTIATSSDGATWAQLGSGVPTDLELCAACWNGSTYVAVGRDRTTQVAPRAISSTNATTWTTRTPDPTSDANGINLLSVAAISGGAFVAVGRDNNAFDRSFTMYSADGITWVARNAANSLVGPLFGVGARP